MTIRKCRRFWRRFAFLSLLLMLSSVFRLLRHRHLIVALHGHQLRLTDNLELAKLNYPPEIVQQLIKLGMVSGDTPPSEWQRVKKKWPAILVVGALLGLLVRYANGCTTFLSGLGTAYLLWLIVDWYDALIVDCVLFCHFRRFVIPGTEDMTEAYHNYMVHIRGSCVGMLIGLPCCLLAGALAALLK